MKRVSLVISVLCLVGSLIGGGIAVYGANLYETPLRTMTQQTLFLVPKGASFSAILTDLQQQDIIDDRTALVMKIAGRLTDANPKAGEYALHSGQSPKDILTLLQSGDVYVRSFTVPEGQTSWQIVQQLKAIDTLRGDIKTLPPEGSLLPETYHFTRGDDRNAKIKRMQSAMAETLDELWQTRADNLPIKTKKDAVILASIVEKETGMTGERKDVAGVFINRLRMGMALQTDPTVIYAITKGEIEENGRGPLGRRLLRKDLKIDSPYNTYLYPGLPPGPIANPGRASIAAVLQPATHDYIYFVADGSGGHAFAKTLAEHNRNVAAWRKIRP